MYSPLRKKLGIAIFTILALMVGASLSTGFVHLQITQADYSTYVPSATLNTGYVTNSSLSYRPYNGTSLEQAATPASNWTLNGKILSQKVDNLSIPGRAKLLPNFDVSPVRTNGVYTPSYTSAPAPMGIGSFGILNSSGTLSPYTYTTSSFEGSLTLNNLSTLYLGADSPGSFGIQLNAVLNNVSLHGHEGFQYWTQNVVDYTSSTHTIQFVDNVWNFTSPDATINGNEFYSYNGTVVPGVFYYTLGPSITVSLPFTLNLYLNYTTVNNHETVFFNYSVSDSSTVRSGSYDEVQFNSSSSTGSPARVPASFEVSGSTLTGTGYVPMDAEFVIGGPGAGSTVNFQDINASISLDYLTTGSGYASVPSAYNVGSETGETSSGISEYYSGNTAYLTPGPSFVNQMWGLSGTPGYQTVSGTIAPSNAFVLISNTTRIDNSSAQWAPVGANGHFNYRLPYGTYSLEILMSYHDPLYYQNILSSGNVSLGSISLKKNVSMGIYTPLYAFNNTQLSYLSATGTGTQSDPYVIPGPAYYMSNGTSVPDVISSVFSQVNDYIYPTFNGIFISGTSDYAIFDGFQSTSGDPAFSVQYPISMLPYLTYNLGVTAGNSLNLVFYNSSNVIVNDSVVSGWFSSLVYSNFNTYNIPAVASLMFWNTTSSLIEHTTVRTDGSGILIYGPGGHDLNNTVWNNTFSDGSSIPAGSLYGNSPIGLTIAGSGNTVFNNEFNSVIPIASIDGTYADIYNGSNVTYSNSFNITREPASHVSYFDGVALSGNILGLPYQSGNFYYNYFGNGSQPYNGTGVGYALGGQSPFNGSINYGYDYSPLTEYSYETNVTASGLPVSLKTYFDINNAIYELSPGSSHTLYLPNGTYEILGFILYNSQVEYMPESTLGTMNLTSGLFTVLGPVMNLHLVYTAYYNVTVSESGLSPGLVWGFSIPSFGVGYALVNNSQSLFLPAGAYDIYPQSVDGYYASTLSTYVTGPASMVIAYASISMNQAAQTYQAEFTESGLPSGTTWGIVIAGHSFSTDNSSMVLIGLSPGIYQYDVQTVSGYTSGQGGYINVSHANATVYISFSRNAGIGSYLPYLASGVGLGLILGGIAVYARMRK